MIREAVWLPPLSARLVRAEVTRGSVARAHPSRRHVGRPCLEFRQGTTLACTRAPFSGIEFRQGATRTRLEAALVSGIIDDDDDDQQQPQAGGEPPREDGAPLGDVQPVVLEVNYSADYGKLLELRPCFLDDVFAKLFLDDGDPGADADETLWEALPL